MTKKESKNNRQISLFDLGLIYEYDKDNGKDNDNYNYNDNDNDILTLSEACRFLSISTATGRNWLKAKRLIPFTYKGKSEGKRPLFKRKNIQQLLDAINSGESDRLKSRRNKKRISGFSAYQNYIEDSGANTQIVERLVAHASAYGAAHNAAVYCERVLRLILAHYSLQLILQKENRDYSNNSLLSDFINGSLQLGEIQALIWDLLADSRLDQGEQEALAFAFNEKPRFIEGQDFLGYVYLSLSNLAQRKIAGVYFTPINVVNQLICEVKNTTALTGKDILDPCCGTGNFLITLKKHNAAITNLYGNDIDIMSCQLARINMALSYQIDDISLLYENITCCDTLKLTSDKQFDIIIGNPPWGYEFTPQDMEYLRKYFITSAAKGMESYDLFIEKSLEMLKGNGLLAFVLPEAILNVRIHEPVRRLLIDKCSFKFINYMGNAFSGVQCPSILLGVICDKQSSAVGCRIIDGAAAFTINEPRALQAECIALNITDSQERCLKKIAGNQDCFTLEGQAEFALGIVTGDNAHFISKEKRPDNEIVLKGSDLRKYTFAIPNNYICFKPEFFQQVAAVERYRAPEKLLYRFICDSLVFAYDNQQTLSLNSCNILIPNVPGIDIKYILAVLNSRVATFWYKKKYSSVKVLRSHIEQIPIPMPSSDEQQKIIEKVNQIMDCSAEQVSDLYEELDKVIMGLYGLSEEEQRIIR